MADAPPPTERIVILSDAHMTKRGGGAGSAEALRPLWRGASRVVFNGDTVETRDEPGREASAQRVAKLRALAAEDGVEITFVAGNHDPLVSDLDWVHLAGNAVLATHGDLLHPATSPWTDPDNQFEPQYRAACAELRETPGCADAQEKAEAAKRAAVRRWREQRWGRFQRASRGWWWKWKNRGRKAALVLYYWYAMPRRAMRFAEEHFPDCRFFVFGHIHRPGIWIDRGRGDGSGRVILNTGSFHVPRWPRAVVIEGGEVSLWRIRFDKRRGHRLASRPMRRFRLSIEI
ncbi:MAG: metallophosphoesterase [Planctomycetota bacterium]